MNNEELAVQTFAIVPEAYQQIFKEAGADFPDDLVTAIKEDPNQAAQLLESDKQLKSAVVKVFETNKEAILGAAQEAQQNTGMFKKGGKLYYGLQKFQMGKKLPGQIKPKGIKGLFFEEIKYPRLDGNPGYVSEYVNAPGDTITTVGGKYNSWQRRTNRRGKPSYKISIGSVPYERTTDPEAIQMLETVHKRFTYPEYQNGGEVPYNGEIKADTRGPVAIWIDKTISNSPTLSRLDKAFNNYKQSAPGKVLGFLTPDFNSEYGIAGAIAPIKKVPKITTANLPKGMSMGKWLDIKKIMKMEMDDFAELEPELVKGLEKGSANYYKALEKEMDALAKTAFGRERYFASPEFPHPHPPIGK